MLRGEKRSLPVDGPSGASGTAAGAGSAHKKAREKMPDFDWSADNYALTWRLVDELRKPENKNVLFPDHENMTVKTGDTKEDVYRRIAKVVHPEAFAQDQQTAGSRMKNKNVAMWKEYSGYCRRLQELCTTHQVVIPANGPDESFPQEVQAEWRKIIISMPVFQALRTFMPVRPEERPKAPTVKTQRGVSSFPQPPPEDEHAVEHHRDGLNSASYPGPVQSPSMKRASVSRDVALGTAEGQNIVNEQEPHVPSLLQFRKLSLTDYLELRRSYHEDVRLGIFTPSETKLRIEVLDKQRSQAESIRSMPPPPSSSASTTSTFSQSLTPQTSTRVIAPDPMLEHEYEEKALLLGFRKPMPPHPLSRLTFKEVFKTILDHAAECELQECRLDSLRKAPQLSFVQAANPHELGMPVEIVFMTRSGLVPLVHHPLAACVRFLSRNTIHAMDLPLVIHTGNGWETTIWDFATAVVAASLRRRLSIEEIKSVQSNAHIRSADPAFRQQFQLLNESSTFFDVLRTGLLSPNNWVPMGQIDDSLDHQVPQH